MDPDSSTLDVIIVNEYVDVMMVSTLLTALLVFQECGAWSQLCTQFFNHKSLFEQMDELFLSFEVNGSDYTEYCLLRCDVKPGRNVLTF